MWNEASQEEDDDSRESQVSEDDESGTPEDDPTAEEWPRGACVGLFLGPVLAFVTGLILRLVAPSGMEIPAQRLVSVTLWMAIWWMTEATPLGITALLPLVLFPPLGILTTDKVAPCYSVSISWLFFGGFQLAFAVEKTGLHRRLALCVLRAVGTRPPCLMLGVMLSVAVLSMFLSNTSTTLMILPVVEAVAASIAEGDTSTDSQHFGKALMLGLAYSASMGGMGTLIGTPPNGVLAAQAETFGLHVTFASWMAFAMPLALLMVPLTWLYLVLLFKVPRGSLAADHPARAAVQRKLGRMSQAEVRVAVIFGLTVLAWMCRKPLVRALGLGKHRLEDSTISIAATILLFVVPARGEDGRSTWLMDWQTLLRTPWHILFLFGGGFALASAFKATMLSTWIGDQLVVLRSLPPFLIAFFVVLTVTFLTEVTSNTATANVLLPIIGQLARSVAIKPAALVVPAALAASCAFMLPVATPPNAIVFATKRIRMKDMAQTGLFLNFATSILITAWMFTWGRLWFDMGPAAAAAESHELANAAQPQPNSTSA